MKGCGPLQVRGSSLPPGSTSRMVMVRGERRYRNRPQPLHTLTRPEAARVAELGRRSRQLLAVGHPPTISWMASGICHEVPGTMPVGYGLSKMPADLRWLRGQAGLYARRRDAAARDCQRPREKVPLRVRATGVRDATKFMSCARPGSSVSSPCHTVQPTGDGLRHYDSWIDL